ncbi:MAG: hypothetical protein ABID87_04970 [Chloroflexota bacterium]
MIQFRACKRCGGDVSREEDRYGAYLQCIQCGAIWNAAPANAAPAVPASTGAPQATPRKVMTAAK